MTAPPDRFDPAALGILRLTQEEYDRAIAAARAEGREQGMRDAAVIANSLLRRASFGTGQTTEVTYCDFVGAAILKAIPAPPADGGDT